MKLASIYANEIWGNILNSFHNEKKIMDLAAIWLTTNPPITENGKQCRITVGTKLKVEGGKIVDLPKDEKPTHIVTSTKGNVSSSILLLGVRNLVTGQNSELNINEGTEIVEEIEEENPEDDETKCLCSDICCPCKGVKIGWV